MKRYSDIPRRKIISSPFADRPITSYGILAIAKKTGRCLLVQSNHSLGMAYLMHGYYQPTHFNSIKHYLTKQEADTLKKIVFNEDLELFTNQYRTMYHRDPPNNYSYQRLLDLKDDILEIDTTTCLDGVLYGIPKGRLNPKEDTIIAAIREFREETGIKIVSNINPEPYVYKTPGVAGGTYQLKCWIYELEDEVDLNTVEITDKQEICHRMWVTIPQVGDSYVEGEFNCDKELDVYIDNESTALINMYYAAQSS